jgi:hypothetical protein
MSIQAVAWALEEHVPDTAAKLVLISLCNALNGDTGLCKPTKSRLAHEASVSIETVTRKLKWLVENGWIEAIPSFDKTGRQTANKYKIMQDWGGCHTDTPGCHSYDMGEGVNCDTPLKKPEDITGIPQTPKGAVDLSQGFDEFWKAFSDTRGKQGALRVWKRKRLHSFQSEIVAGAKAYVESRGDDKKYWKQAKGWLNDGRWEDFSIPVPDNDQWVKRLKYARRLKIWWADEWGPQPNESGCGCPSELHNLTDGGWDAEA